VSTAYAIAMTTVADEAKARDLARAALETRLAACVQAFPIRSHYVWKDALCEEAEVVLHFKIRHADFAALRELIRARHDYEIPEILLVEIADGDDAYLDWLAASTTRPALP
jgi:periplasmic divalent cation tolerance protein